jgi:hypothetical protein
MLVVEEVLIMDLLAEELSVDLVDLVEEVLEDMDLMLQFQVLLVELPELQILVEEVVVDLGPDLLHNKAVPEDPVSSSSVTAHHKEAKK